MGFKDTVMSDEVIKDEQMAGKPWELWRLRKVAEAQAEITYKAGVEEGVRTVLVWLTPHRYIEHPKGNYYYFREDELQAKLKEWGL